MPVNERAYEEATRRHDYWLHAKMIRRMFEDYEEEKSRPLPKGETATFEQIVPGVTVYYVHALGVQSFTWEYLILKHPKMNEHTKSFFVEAFQALEKYATEFSLLDSNVITNGYNKHKLFLSKASADAYLNKCKQGND